ncbi:MAG: two-CW domain-containing protein [Armatimonadota bacterium]
MTKQNCWEFKKCGREPGGIHVHEFGVCPAATETKLDVVNEGKNGGRCCWAIAGTLCEGKVQGSFASKFTNCTKCDFYRKVIREEGMKFTGSTEILRKLHS